MATYKTSSLTLYYTSTSANWELLPHKLFVVDSIEDYLATKTYLSIANFQYQKPQLELSIVVDLSQTYAEPLNTSFKYVKIINEDQVGGRYYYFVKNVEWRSKSAVRLNLVMDVLNTFKEGTHYAFKDSTKITREHKDRFVQGKIIVDIYFADDYSLTGIVGLGSTITVNTTVGGYLTERFTGQVTAVNSEHIKISITTTGLDIEEIIRRLDDNAVYVFKYNDSNYIESHIAEVFFDSVPLYRKIDYVPENINPLLNCGSSEGTLIEHNKTKLRCDWYLLYRNTNQPDDKATSNTLVNPVECYVIPSEEIQVKSGGIVAGRLNGTSLNLSYYYYLELTETLNWTSQSVTLDNGTTLTPNANTAIKTWVVLKRNSDNTISVECFEGRSGENKLIGVWTCKYITLNNVPFYYYRETYYVQGSAYDITSHFTGGTYYTWTNTVTPNVLSDITKLDRTDAKNIKLIKLPYCPYDFTITSDQIDVSSDSNWDYISLSQDNGSMYCLKLNDLNVDLTVTFNNYSCIPNGQLFLNNISVINPQNTDLRKNRGAVYESKLFNSEFYRPTFVYDSFQFTAQLEKCDINYYITNTYITNFPIQFDVTKTINSKFMFTFPNYILSMANENYAKYMPIARNNEEVLYNVPYINYIRYGYQYDIKARNISNANNWIGAGLSLVGAGVALFAPSAPLKILGVATSLISMAMTAKNAITSTIQNEQSIQRKLTEMRNQTASVSGSDDVDLMSVYAQNRLKYLVYAPSDIMKNMIYNLFFFAGYASNRMGLPNHNTRLNFDYLECDAIIEKTANIPDDCLSELINCFKNGVTYIHKTNRASNKWDFAQQYENWEKSLGVN